MDERPPLRPLWFADQTHVRLSREPISLSRIAGDARANDVLPRRVPSTIARHDVIEVELAAVENLAAVLTSVLIALENVVTSKFHFLLRKPIENQEHDYPRDTNLERNCGDDLVVRCVGRQITPAFEIVRHEIVCIVR